VAFLDVLAYLVFSLSLIAFAIGPRRWARLPGRGATGFVTVVALVVFVVAVKKTPHGTSASDASPTAGPAPSASASLTSATTPGLAAQSATPASVAAAARYTAPAQVAAAPPAQAPAATTGCYPLSSSGHCYKPGQYCRTRDHNTQGIALNGEPIVCTYNDGWRWEPA
jgi:hypothetical protein